MIEAFLDDGKTFFFLLLDICLLSCLVDWWKSNDLVNEIAEDVWILLVILVHQISLQFKYPSTIYI